MLQQTFCIGPAFTLFANTILNRDFDVLEENSVDRMGTCLLYTSDAADE